MNRAVRAVLIPVIGVALAVFTLYEVNLAELDPQARLGVFGLLGLVLCFLIYPTSERWKDVKWLQSVDLLWAIASAAAFGYVVIQSQPTFEQYWAKGQSLSNRAGIETDIDIMMAWVGLIVVLEATRRSIGLALPLLALAFMAHAYYGESLPDWAPEWLMHAQMKPKEIASKSFLQTLGVFGPALNVMFTYVFLFVVFGAFLEVTGATQFIVDFAERVFARSPGGPAKVSVLGSGLMGSLSGSAVANAVTTGTFTIPMMRNAGFQPHVAGGITAAAASGGALVPPVMGAGAYMMLELVEPPVTFLEIAMAALIPAVLYYFSIFMIVHFYSGRIGVAREGIAAEKKPLLQLLGQFEGIVFLGALVSLVGFLVWGYSPFRAVTLSLGVIVSLAVLRYLADVLRGLKPLNAAVLKQALKTTQDALVKAARNGVSLVSASACVGIIIAVVQTTGVAGDFNALIKGVVEESLLLALIGIMGCSLVLGMGVPSVVCYLLMATLMGGLLRELGVIPLAAHLFIFYFGMMSMVTPPVALAAFASASIAGANIMRTGFSAFMFSLVGFTLPFMFVYRPELLLLSDKPELQQLRMDQTRKGETLIRGSLLHVGQGLGDAQIEFTDEAGGETVLLTTDERGGFQLPARAATWRVDWLRFEPVEDESANDSEDSDTGDAADQAVGGEGSGGESGITTEVRLAILNRERLGVLTCDPEARVAEDESAAKTAAVGAAKSEDPRLTFKDQRLSILQVVMGTTAAVLGIVALAAGIAGYLRGPMGVAWRVLAFVAAALMLYPGEGFRLSGVNIGYGDLAGMGIFLVLMAFGSRKREGDGT